MIVTKCHVTYEFQSTHPVRGATDNLNALGANSVISIHAPREGCDVIALCRTRGIVISIHAPREGCDMSRRATWYSSHHFNPRTP